MTMNRKLRRIFSSVFTIACAIGMIYQQLTILNLYLQYKVTTTTSIYIPRILEYLALTACFPPTVINLPLLNQETSSNWTEKALKDDSLITTISVETLQKYTPSAESIIYYYGYVDPRRNSDSIPNMNFSSEQFMYHNYVCYKIRLNSYHAILLEDAAGPGALGRIIFTSKVYNITQFRIAFGSPDKVPMRDITASRFIQRNGNATRKDFSNSFQSNHFEIDTQSLPYPYESNCYDYKSQGINDDFECLNACFVNKSLEQFSRFPTNAVILKDLNYTILPYSLGNNSTLYTTLSRLKVGCRAQCAKIPCHDTQVVTLTDNGVYNEAIAKYKELSIMIFHMIPVFPFVNITSRPSQSIEEIITLALSSVSTWTGLSIFALNPVTLLTRLFLTSDKIQALDRTSHVHHGCLFTRKKQQELLYLLTSRDTEIKTMRRELNRISGIMNSPFNSRLA